MTGTELTELLMTAVVAGVGAYIGSYLAGLALTASSLLSIGTACPHSSLVASFLQFLGSGKLRVIPGGTVAIVLWFGLVQCLGQAVLDIQNVRKTTIEPAIHSHDPGVELLPC